MAGQGLVFLSHWSGDKSKVQELYKVLDQSRAFLDVKSMNAGNDNLEEMQAAVTEASVFVFIISPQVPKNCFSFFEADCARYTKIRDKDLQVLVWPINGASFHDAPEWMRKYFAVPREYSVADVGREIQRLVLDFLRSKNLVSPEHYYGREDEERRTIIDINSSTAKSGKAVNAIFVSGFPGLGRRTFASHLLKNQYPALRQSVAKFDLPDSAEAIDLYLAIVADLSNGLSLARIADLRQAFPTAPARQAELIYSGLLHWLDLKLPVIVQMRWGLLDGSGNVSQWCAELLKLLDVGGAGGILVLVSGRRPRPENLITFRNVVGVQLRALDDVSINYILSKLILPEMYNPALIEGLTALIGGHPDTAHQVAYLVNQGRSIDTILTNRSLIYSFKDKIIEDLMEPGFLSLKHHSILQLIAWHPQLNTKSLSEVLNEKNIPEMVDVLWELSDYSLIERSQNDTFTVNKVAVSTLLRQPEILSADVKKRLVQTVQGMLGRDDLLPEQIEPILFTMTSAGQELPPLLKSALTPSTLYSVIERHYLRGRAADNRSELERNMRIASQLAPIALSLAPTPDLLESILFYGADALIRIGQDPEGLAFEMEKRGFASVHLVRGSAKYHILGDDEGAIKELKVALGRKKFRRRVTRMLARIQLRVGRAPEALQTLARLSDRELEKDSGFLVLKIRALRLTKNHPEADRLQTKLKEIGDDHGDLFVFEAARLIKKGDYSAALDMVDRALHAPKVNRTPLMTLRCSIELMMGDASNLTSACALAEGAGRFDDACELRARAALIRGDWREAEREIENVRLSTWYTLQIRLQATDAKLKDVEIRRDAVELAKSEAMREDILRRMLSAEEIRF